VVFTYVCVYIYISVIFSTSDVFAIQLFGGFLVSLKDVTQWVSWLQYASIFRYGFNVCSKNLTDRASRFKWDKCYIYRPSCGMNWKVLHTAIVAGTPRLSMKHAL